MQLRLAFAAVACVVGCALTATAAQATICSSSNPYTWNTTSIANGNTADASPVMGNFNYLLYCANTNVAPQASPSFTGNVGIGTANPLTALHVMSGTQNVSGDQNSALVVVETANTTTKANLSIITNTAFGANIGGTLGLGGRYRSSLSDSINYAVIRGAKEDSNDAHYGGYLAFSTITDGAAAVVERMRINSTGNVGIGTTTPQRTLDLGTNGQLTFGDNGYSSTGSPGFFWYNDNFSYAIYKTAGSWSGPNYQQLTLRFATGIVIDGGSAYGRSGTVLQPAGGYVGVGTTTPATALHVVGTIRQTNCISGNLYANGSGDIGCASDARLKNIQGDYAIGLEAVTRITPKLFTFRPTKADPNETFVHAGFIAQDVIGVIPQASALQPNGYYSLDTTAILAATVNSVKQLKALTDRQASEIARLRDVNAGLAQSVRSLEARMAVLERKSRTQTARN